MTFANEIKKSRQFVSKKKKIKINNLETILLINQQISME